MAKIHTGLKNICAKTHKSSQAHQHAQNIYTDNQGSGCFEAWKNEGGSSPSSCPTSTTGLKNGKNRGGRAPLIKV